MNAQMNENVMTNNEITTSAPYFWYDHTKARIIGKELNFKKSGIPGSAQDKALMFAKTRHPEYKYYVTTAFKKVMPEIYKAYTKQVSSRRFTISA